MIRSILFKLSFKLRFIRNIWFFSFYQWNLFSSSFLLDPYFLRILSLDTFWSRLTKSWFLFIKMYSLSICWSFLNARILYRHYDYMVISKLVPCILLDFTWIEPPILFTILLQMLKPRPVPYLFRLLLWSSFPKSKKSFSRSSSAMPIPVSFIVILYLT